MGGGIILSIWRRELRTRLRTLIPVLLLAWALAGCGVVEPGSEATAKGADIASEHFQRGNEFVGNGQFEEAIAEYVAALEAKPDHISAMTNLGVAYYNTGQFEEAISQYQEALEIAPDDAAIHSNLAATYVQVGDLVTALQEYEKAVALQPDLAQAHFGLAVVYIELGNNAQAIETLERFQTLDTGEDPMATDLARQYLEQLKEP
jgi:tetratricopeptide (TPR) repeat protein